MPNSRNCFILILAALKGEKKNTDASGQREGCKQIFFCNVKQKEEKTFSECVWYLSLTNQAQGWARASSTTRLPPSNSLCLFCMSLENHILGRGTQSTATGNWKIGYTIWTFHWRLCRSAENITITAFIGSQRVQKIQKTERKQQKWHWYDGRNNCFNSNEKLHFPECSEECRRPISIKECEDNKSRVSSLRPKEDVYMHQKDTNIHWSSHFQKIIKFNGKFWTPFLQLHSHFLFSSPKRSPHTLKKKKILACISENTIWQHSLK